MLQTPCNLPSLATFCASLYPLTIRYLNLKPYELGRISLHKGALTPAHAFKCLVMYASKEGILKMKSAHHDAHDLSERSTKWCYRKASSKFYTCGYTFRLRGRRAARDPETRLTAIPMSERDQLIDLSSTLHVIRAQRRCMCLIPLHQKRLISHYDFK